MSAIRFLFDGHKNARWTVALAHGAGAGMDSPFMVWFAEGLARRGFRVARFEFPYMAKRRRSGKRGPPDKLPVLMQTWREVIDAIGRDHLVIGMVADEAQVKGLVCLGYPFHPVGKPGQLRVEHLQKTATPTLILQGTRDPFGSQTEVADYWLPASIKVHWLADGDHDFKPRKASGRTQRDLWQEAAETIQDYLADIGGLT